MKNGLKSPWLCLLMTAALILVNGFLYYTAVCSAEIIQSRDIYGVSHTSERRFISLKEQLLSSLSGDYETDISGLSAETEILAEYRQVADYIINDNYTAILRLNDLSPEERREKAEQLYSEVKKRFPVSEERLMDRIREEIDAYNSIIGYLEYLDGYKEYVTDIAEQSDFLSDITIYNENDGIAANIIKTKKDFYGLSNITLSPVTEEGFIVFVSFRLTDFLAVIAVIILLPLIKSHRRGSFALAAAAAFGASLLMQLTNLVLTDIFIGLPPMDAAVQSMESFRTCPYIINTGVLAGFLIFMKSAGCAVLLFILMLCISGVKRGIPWAGLLLAEGLFALLPAAPDFLREINLFSFFSFERFFIRYLNLEAFGLTVSRLPVFLLFGAALAVLSVLFAERAVRKQRTELIKLSEQSYYDEINRRYQESRKIRHDINNHLLAVSALIESGNTEQAKKYISEVSEQIDLAAMPVKTGAQVLDALLFKKSGQAEAMGIRLSFEVSCPLTDCGISDYDLCTVFGNIIDNALEAAEKGDTVSLVIENQLDMLYISCENPFSGTLRRKGDKILTTKPNPLSHGYGIARVKEIARHYNGDVRITDTGGKFLIEILMNI